MAGAELYLYGRCTSCRKADVFIRRAGVSAKRRDLFKERLSAIELADLCRRAGVTAGEIVSTRSRPYQELGLAEKNLSDEELVGLMAEYPALVRRPIVVSEAGTLVGFNTDVYADWASRIA